MPSLEARIVAHHTYPKSSWWDVPEVEDGSRVVSQALTRISGVTARDDSARATFVDHPNWLIELASHRDGPLLVYWGGHAEMLGNSYAVAFPESGPQLSELTSLTFEKLAAVVAARQSAPPADGHADWLLLILDTCQSVAGAEQIWHATQGKRRDTAIVATSTEVGSAFAGRFPILFAQFLDEYGQNDAQVDLLELLRRIGDALDEEQQTSGGAHLHTSIRAHAAVWPRRDHAPLVGLRSDVKELVEVLAASPDVIRNHFYAKAASVGLNQLDWEFTGRIPERTRIARWMDEVESEIQMLTVTGPAGSGKSALLGMVLASTSPELVVALSQLGVDIPTDTVPTNTSFTATLHLSNRTIDEVVAEAASQEGFDNVQSSEDLIGRYQKASGPRLVLADALDESRDPIRLARLMHQIAEQPGCRVLVGTRRSLTETPDNPIPLDHALTDALVPDEMLTVDASKPSFRNYVRRRLQRAMGERPDDQVRELADTIAEKATTFLYARVAVEEIIADPGWTATKTALAMLLTPTHTGIFEKTVSRLQRTEPNTEHLLHALAYARGNGFPRTGRIWEVAGSAVAGVTLRDPDIRRALKTAAPYITQDTEFGNEVYRLGHRTFVEYYHGRDAR
ncbi:hypothetical protein SAMN04487846_2839 [Microbacterium sp. cf046]|uniref:hypothetical protein n=1 Tax=Microbacterium sp. cf046 TaxID=1761803 RepID=UPI0008E0C6C8|nr:hypothetical protein [Microbacterium sp. cf046]SFS14061.1 hypothetical protein SAMN04487846_2839 [Microbacterium sp. cf046]